MPWPELRFAVAELAARRAMRLEAEQAERDAARVRELARRRVTVPTSRWGASDRELLRRHRELTSSLRALRRELHPVVQSRRSQASTCPACVGVYSSHMGIG